MRHYSISVFPFCRLLDDQHIPLLQLLEDKAVAMAFSLESSFFDEYPLMFDNKNVAGMQHPKPSSAILKGQSREFMAVHYAESFLKP